MLTGVALRHRVIPGITEFARGGLPAPAATDDGNEWVDGGCWLYCGQRWTRVLWIGPASVAGAQAPMYACGPCIRVLQERSGSQRWSRATAAPAPSSFLSRLLRRWSDGQVLQADPLNDEHEECNHRSGDSFLRQGLDGRIRRPERRGHFGRLVEWLPDQLVGGSLRGGRRLGIGRGVCRCELGNHFCHEQRGVLCSDLLHAGTVCVLLGSVRSIADASDHQVGHGLSLVGGAGEASAFHLHGNGTVVVLV